MGEMRLNPLIVGEVIAAYRLRKGVTQEVLSGLADIGRTHLSAIERGGRKPTLETLYRISLALDVVCGRSGWADKHFPCRVCRIYVAGSSAVDLVWRYGPDGSVDGGR